MTRWFTVSAGLLAFCASCSTGIAGDLTPMPVKVKAPPKAEADSWSGFYVGGHFGIAAGDVDWRASGFGGPQAPLSGSIDLFNGFNAFKGTGSYFGGFQAGYNYLLPSGLALGVETDISFANTISGTALIAAPSIGEASSTDNVQMFGTLRGRAGIVRDNWASQKSDMHRLTRRRRTYAILSIERKTGLERPSIQNHEICLVGRECSAPK